MNSNSVLSLKSAELFCLVNYVFPEGFEVMDINEPEQQNTTWVHGTVILQRTLTLFGFL